MGGGGCQTFLQTKSKYGLLHAVELQHEIVIWNRIYIYFALSLLYLLRVKSGLGVFYCYTIAPNLLIRKSINWPYARQYKAVKLAKAIELPQLGRETYDPDENYL